MKSAIAEDDDNDDGDNYRGLSGVEPLYTHTTVNT